MGKGNTFVLMKKEGKATTKSLMLQTFSSTMDLQHSSLTTIYSHIDSLKLASKPDLVSSHSLHEGFIYRENEMRFT